MSFKLTAVAWNVGVEKSTDRLVLLALASKADDNGRNCFPSVDGICAMTMMNRKTVFAAITRLADRGLLSVKKRACTNSNEYVLHIDQWTENGSTENGSTQKRDNSKTEQRSSQKRNDGSTENGTTVVPKTGHDSINTLSTTQSCTQSIDTPAPDHFRDVTKKVETPKKEKRPNRWVLVDRPEGVSPEAWKNFCQIRAVKRIPLTETAWKGIEKEAAKAGLSLSETIDICNEHGWAGFKNSWLQNAQRPQVTAKPTDPQYGIGVCQPPKEPTRMFTPEEAEETRRQMMEEGLIF